MRAVVTADALIIGGGPSGTAAAIVLARAGMKVALLERSAYDTERIGETLPPEVSVPLTRLGVWDRFRKDGHQEAPGLVSCWGSSEPYQEDFILNPHGCGWHVDRARFDRMLAEAAGQVGAELFLAATARTCAREAGSWIVEAEREGRRMRFRAPYLVEAFGRSRGPARAGDRIRYDRLMGCVAFLDSREGPDLEDPRAMVEACPEGWWYSAQLPQGKLVLAFMTDSDLIATSRGRALEALLERLRESRLSQRWLRTFPPPEGFRRVAADTYWRPPAAANRLAAGDAAMAFDPLSSQGVLKALLSGERAAQAILAAHAGNESAFQEYRASLEGEFRIYLEERLRFYRAEQRWPESPFWHRRHSVSPVYPPIVVG